MEHVTESITSVLKRNNPLMLILFGTSVLCGAVILDRSLFWIRMTLRFRPVPAALLDGSVRNREGLIAQLQHRRRRHYIQELLLAALTGKHTEDSITQTMAEQLDIMSTRLGMLDLIARLAPLLGILGTVTGMAVSFGGIGAMAAANPAEISSGISLALQSTAYGLMVSIIASTASAVFRRFNRNAQIRMGRMACNLSEVTYEKA
jgi:biopolymer transport protein ExbB/TolQ